MENDRVLDSEALIRQENSGTVRSPTKGSSLTKGHDAALAAGGVEALPAYEDTPLLQRDGSISSESSDEEDSIEQTGLHWSGAEDFKGLPWWRKPSLYWLLPALLLNTLAYGAIIVPKVNLILNLVCNNYFADQATRIPGFTFVPVLLQTDHDPRCTQNNNVQASVAKFTLAMQLLGGLLSSITSPKLGSLSDRYGRIKIILLGSVGIIIMELTTILAGRFPDTFSVNWILVGAALDGLCGSFTTTMAVVNAYAADTNAPARRGVVFGWVHGCLFTGIAIGPLIAASVIRSAGNILVIFYVSIAAHTIIMIYIALFVPESVTKKRQMASRQRQEALNRAVRRASSMERAGTRWIDTFRSTMRRLGITSFFSPLSILWPTGPNTTSALRRNLVILASVDTIQFGVAMGAMTVVVLYTGKAFDWGSVETSYLIAITNSCRVFVLFVLLPTITRMVRGKFGAAQQAKNTGSDRLDLLLIWASLAFDVVAFGGYAIARHPTLFIVSACIGSVGGMGSPTLQSSLTKHIPADRVGQMMGAMGMLHGLARVVSPTVFHLIYAKTVATFPQTVFVTLTAVFGLALTISLFIRPHGKSLCSIHPSGKC
jgi:MFS family permease